MNVRVHQVFLKPEMVHLMEVVKDRDVLIYAERHL